LAPGSLYAAFRARLAANASRLRPDIAHHLVVNVDRLLSCAMLGWVLRRATTL
jgi:sulfite exporter TauE/SafE